MNVINAAIVRLGHVPAERGGRMKSRAAIQALKTCIGIGAEAFQSRFVGRLLKYKENPIQKALNYAIYPIEPNESTFNTASNYVEQLSSKDALSKKEPIKKRAPSKQCLGPDGFIGLITLCLSALLMHYILYPDF